MSSRNPLVSVIVPVFETNPVYLEKCLTSVLSQDFSRYEIIVVDDGSSEEYKEAKTFSSFKDNSRLKIITHENNMGLSSARNTGIKHATGEYILTIDSDDFWTSKNVISKLYKIAIVDDCDILRFNGAYFRDGTYGQSIVPELSVINGSIFNCSDLRVYRSTFLYFIKKDFLTLNCINFNENISVGEDVYFTSKILGLSEKISSISDCFYAYRINDKGMMQSKWKISDFLSEINASYHVLKNISSSTESIFIYMNFSLRRIFRLMLRAQLELRNKDRTRLISEYNKYYKHNISICKTHDRFFQSFKILIQYYIFQIHIMLTYLLTPFPSVGRILKKILIYSKIQLRLLKRIKLFFVSLRKITRQVEHFGKNKKYLSQTNIEGYDSYQLDFANDKQKSSGLSGLMRVKNEKQYISRSILSILPVVDELVIVDNNSDDGTVEIIQEIITTHREGKKIEFFSYPFTISACGRQHNDTPEDSIHSLAYFNNWALQKCSRKTILKWDGDMIFPKEEVMISHLKKLSMKVSRGYPLVAGWLDSQIIFAKGKELFTSHSAKFGEVRLFKNSKYVFFRKGINYEILTFGLPARIVKNNSIRPYEVKDLSISEFNHWSEMSFSDPRKIMEYRFFRALNLGLTYPGADLQIASKDILNDQFDESGI